MVPGWEGGYFSGDQDTTNQNRRKLYQIAYKQYVKAKGNLSSYNSMGAQIGENVKNHDKNSKEIENNDNKYHINIKKVESNDNK